MTPEEIRKQMMGSVEAANKPVTRRGESSLLEQQKLVADVLMSGVSKGIDNEILSLADATAQALISIARPVTDTEELAAVAARASGGDARLGNHVASLFEQAGVGAPFIVQRSETGRTQARVALGTAITANEVAISGNPAAGQSNHWQLNDPCIVAFSSSLDDSASVSSLLQRTEGLVSLVVICSGDIAGEAATAFLEHKKSHSGTAVLLKIDDSICKGVDILSDLAALTGCEIVENCGSITQKNVGRSKLAVFDGMWLHVVDADGDLEIIKALAEETRASIASQKDEKQRELLTERLVRLNGGVGVLEMGCEDNPSDNDSMENANRALEAAYRAIKSGVVVGQGAALIHAAKVFLKNKQQASAAEELFEKALEEPFRRFVRTNGGDASVITAGLRTRDATDGYDFSRSQWVDLFKVRTIECVDDVAKMIAAAVDIALERK